MKVFLDTSFLTIILTKKYREKTASFSPFFFVLSIFICNFAADIHI